MVPDVVRIFDVAEEILARGAIHVRDAGGDREFDRNQLSVDFVVEALPGCLRGPIDIRWAPTTKCVPSEQCARTEC